MAKWILAVIMCYFGMRAWAEEKNTQPAAAAKSDSDKLDLKQLEDKYWSAKDTDFSVVQNRTYVKDHRWFVSAGYGTLINDAYSTGRMTNLSGGYYFSERYGMEIARETGNLADNGSTNALAQYNGLKPNYNKFVDYTSVNFLWVPMYAKMSVLDHAIWYFDLQFALGLGNMNYQNQISTLEGQNINKSAIGYNFDVTSHVFFARNWAFRMDIKNKFTSENQQRFQMTGSSASTRDMGTNPQQDSTFLLGFTWFH